MSSDEHPTDPDKARADGSPVGEESHSVQQDAEQPSTSDTASVAAITMAIRQLLHARLLALVLGIPVTLAFGSV